MDKSDYRFAGPPNTASYVCRHVFEEGAPILYVSHDRDGDWQFLCGGEHGDDAAGAAMLCLSSVVELDPSVNAIADMPVNHAAVRHSVTADWVVTDLAEQVIRDDVAEFGWHVAMLPPGSEPGELSFAYSIGFQQSLSHPEVVCSGLPLETMHAILNECGNAIRAGASFDTSEPQPDILEGHSCFFRPVHARHYRELGYACWFYGGREFPALQLLWPDAGGLFPWQDGYDSRPQLQLYE